MSRVRITVRIAIFTIDPDSYSEYRCSDTYCTVTTWIIPNHHSRDDVRLSSSRNDSGWFLYIDFDDSGLFGMIQVESYPNNPESFPETNRVQFVNRESKSIRDFRWRRDATWRDAMNTNRRLLKIADIVLWSLDQPIVRSSEFWFSQSFQPLHVVISTVTNPTWCHSQCRRRYSAFVARSTWHVA